MKSIQLICLALLFHGGFLAQEVNHNNNTNISKETNTNEIQILEEKGAKSEETDSIVNDFRKERKFIEKKSLDSQTKLKSEAPATEQTEAIPKEEIYRSSSQDYKAVQYQSTHNPASRSASPVLQEKMDENLELMNVVAPDAFETNLFNYWNGHYDSKNAPYLLRAAEQNPENKELRQQLSAYYYIENDSQAVDSITTKMVTDGTFCSGQINYATDLMNSAQANSTLIVHGFDDFLPLVNVMGAATYSFNVVSLDLLQSPEYRQTLATKGYVVPESNEIDTAYLNLFVEVNSDKNIQLSLTLPKEYLQSFLPDLYPLGLTFTLVKRDEDEEYNAGLWENKWNKEILLKGTNDWGDTWTKNYLPALVTLKMYYDRKGNTEESKKVSEVILAISSRSNLKQKVSKYAAE
jgi:hypothetical protein